MHLCERDAQAIFDISVNLKFGDISNIYRTSCNFEHSLLEDFPAEVFLQRGDIIKSLLDSLDGTRGIFVTPIGFSPLLAFLNKLAKVHQTYTLARPHLMSNTANVAGNAYTSTLSKKIQSSSTSSFLSQTRGVGADFIYWSYPCSDVDRLVDNPRVKAPESISSFDAVKLITLRAISNLSDRTKIGIYVTIIHKCISLLPSLPHNKRKMENLLASSFDRFADIMRYYGDELYASAILH